MCATACSANRFSIWFVEPSRYSTILTRINGTDITLRTEFLETDHFRYTYRLALACIHSDVARGKLPSATGTEEATKNVHNMFIKR